MGGIGAGWQSEEEHAIAAGEGEREGATELKSDPGVTPEIQLDESPIWMPAESNNRSRAAGKAPGTPKPASVGPMPRIKTGCGTLPVIAKPTVSTFAPVPATLRADTLVNRAEGVPVSVS